MTHHLVAGGSGFIGSHLVDLFLSRGDSVTVVDNLLTGRYQNISHAETDPRFRFVYHDITNPLPPEITDDWYDTVLDLASPASPLDFLTLPLEILSVGSTGTKNLLDLAHRQNAKFFLASTSEVYGDPLIHPQSESYFGNVSCTGPRSCYDEAKRFSEALTMAYHRVNELNIRIVRIFNTYGERMRPDDGRVVNTFISQALKDEPITVYGDGKQTRSFCHVVDEVHGLAAVLDGNMTTGPINVGNPQEIAVVDLAKLIIDLTNSNSQIIHKDLPFEREGDPLQRCPDITMISELYGWQPAISLRNGLTRMIKWFIETET